MKRSFWMLIALLLAAALLLGGFVLMRHSHATPEGATSPHGETEIIPDNPNEPWPDMMEDSASGASDDPGAASLPTSPGDTGSSGDSPDSGVSPAPDSGTEDSQPAVTTDGLHAYELPYLPLS